jgi:hypothetical protein
MVLDLDPVYYLYTATALVHLVSYAASTHIYAQRTTIPSARCIYYLSNSTGPTQVRVQSSIKHMFT